MKKNYQIFLIFIFISTSCNSWKDMMISKGNQNDAIHNAIIDFLHNKKLTKDDSVYHILIKDFNKDVLGISIVADMNKLLPNPENKIGSNHIGFPTMFIERENKLFYWYDSTHFVTQELISTLSNYHRIDSININGFVGIPENSYTINESKKGMDYYFCKNNLVIYKRSLSKIGIGFYPPPNLKCHP